MQSNEVPLVLLIDDDVNLRDSIKRNLRDEPYKLIALESAWSCMETLAEESPAVIISDLNMPGINGAELLGHLKVHHPKIVRVMLSGNLNLDVALDAVNRCQVFRCLEKPCHPSLLALTVREALKHHEMVVNSLRLLDMVHWQGERIKEMYSVSSSTAEDTSVLVLDDQTVLYEKANYDLSSLIQEAVKEVEKIEIELAKQFRTTKIDKI